VGLGTSGIAGGSCPRIPQKLVLGLQTVDGVGTHHGLDQHEDYFGCCLLLRRYAHWNDPAVAWQGPDGQRNQNRPEQLPDHPETPSGRASEAAVLGQELGSGSAKTFDVRSSKFQNVARRTENLERIGKRGNHGRVFVRALVLYEGAKEILDAPDYCLFASAGKPDCFDLRFGRGAVRLHAFLEGSSERSAVSRKSQRLAASLRVLSASAR
jgi:hypothetical protein